MSDFYPAPNTTLLIDGDRFSFTQERRIVYREKGKAAWTFRLLKLPDGRRKKSNWDGDLFALKVFFNDFRYSPTLLNTQPISQLSVIPGLTIAKRKLLSKSDYPDLIEEHAGLENAILMPWIEGKTWNNFLFNQTELSSQASLRIAGFVANLLATLEEHEREHAHCDVSSKNLILRDDSLETDAGIDGSGVKVELLDIEEMYGQGFASPQEERLPAGSEGYSATWVRERGLWRGEADRYAGAILIAELLAWSNPEVRSARAGESFFEAEEVGKSRKGERFKLVRSTLKTIDTRLADLFVQAWSASKIENCPPLSNWREAIPVSKAQPNGKKRTGIPPSKKTALRVSPSLLDFGIVDSRKGTGSSAVFSIQNRGEVELSGTISHPSWLSPSKTEFKLAPGMTEEVRVFLLKGMPIPANGRTYSFSRGIFVETDGGFQILGGMYTLK